MIPIIVISWYNSFTQSIWFAFKWEMGKCWRTLIPQLVKEYLSSAKSLKTEIITIQLVFPFFRAPAFYVHVEGKKMDINCFSAFDLWCASPDFLHHEQAGQFNAACMR